MRDEFVLKCGRLYKDVPRPSTANCPYVYLWSEQPAADSVPQTGPCAWGFPWSRVSLFLETAAGLIPTLLLIGIALTHSFSGMSLPQLWKRSFHRRPTLTPDKSTLFHKRTSSSKGRSSPRAATSHWSHRLEESWWSSPVQSSGIFTKLSVSSSRLGIVSGQKRARKGTKPGRLPTTLASVLFYFPDGFGGLTPENPLLPSLPTCSRLPLRGVLAGNLASEVGSSRANSWLLLVAFNARPFCTSPDAISVFKSAI